VQARDALGEVAAAGRVLERALDITEANGMLLPFLLDPVPALLERHRRTGTAHPQLISQLLHLLTPPPGGPGGHGGAGSPPGSAVLGGIVPPGENLPPGNTVLLEPLRYGHVAGLVAAAAGGGDLYRWSPVPQDEGAVRRYVEAALAARDGGTAVPFAVVRREDDAVIGSTRFWNLDYWAWPDPKPAPDTCEIGYTWLSRDAIRTGANTEMKRLMLTHAFEVWQVRSVCLHTDARNQRSRDAMARIGARFEGILRSHRLGADGRPRDSARFSVTAADWPAVRSRLDELTRRYQLT
jgi:N-acetyltransferase